MAKNTSAEDTVTSTTQPPAENTTVQSATSTTVANKPKEGMVEVEAAKLQALFSRIERLEASASKSALAHFDEKNREKPGKTVKLRLVDGKVVVGEKTVSNVVEKNPQGVWREDIQSELTFQDSSKVTMPTVFYTRAFKHEVVRVLSETKLLEEEDIKVMGPCIFKVRRDSGEILEVGEKFLN